LGHHNDQAPILVGEEEVLGVRARDRGAQGCRLLDGKHGLVLDRGRLMPSCSSLANRAFRSTGIWHPPVWWVALIRGRSGPSYWQRAIVDIAQAINYKPSGHESADGKALRR